MTQDEFDNKFNRIYDEIINFIHWMAHRNCNEEHVMLSFDDVEQELLEEFIKGFKHYCEKPDSQLKAILRQMVANRCSELKYRHFVTHRVKANINISIDMDITCERIHAEDGNPEALLLSKERVEQTRLALSPDAQKVFDSLIAGDEHLSWIAWMNCTRRNSTGKGMAKVHIEPWMVSEATNLDERVVKDAMKEIEAAYYMLGG